MAVASGQCSRLNSRIAMGLRSPPRGRPLGFVLPVIAWRGPRMPRSRRSCSARPSPRDGAVVGCPALEYHGRAALLRSVAVDNRLRGRGLGAAWLNARCRSTEEALAVVRGDEQREVSAMTNLEPVERSRWAGPDAAAWPHLADVGIPNSPAHQPEPGAMRWWPA